jgi:predicted DNA-binding transcriptional regulator AlpA
MHTLDQREANVALRPDELLDLRAVCRYFGGTRPLNPSTLYRNIAKGLLPAPIKIAPNSSRWLGRECEAALVAMIERRAGR